VIEQLGTASDAELLAGLVELEAELARLQYRQLAVLAELNSRNVPGTLGFRGLPDLVAAQLRCTRVEARRRAQAVERFGSRWSLTGEVLDPHFPATAAAFTAGEIGCEHAAAVAETVEAIPATDRAEHAATVESMLLEHARTSDPRGSVAGSADPGASGSGRAEPGRAAAAADPPPAFTDPTPDSTGLLEGRLTPSCLAIWEAILTPLAARRPDDALGPDARSPAQRLHDAFEEAGRRLLATGNLPDHAGLPSQLIITMSLTDLERRAGRATTHHGGTLTIDQALHLAADGGLLPAVLDDAGGILGYGRGRRLASPGQRKALFARDRGCTFPGCTRTAAQSEIHHTTDWATGGHTNLDTMTITCGHHNTQAPKMGWHTLMIDGIPHWQPPPWHPYQQPLRNYVHHSELLRTAPE
jgi:Domain of unknown function (DUF222)